MPIGRIGTDFIVDTTTTGNQGSPRIAALADGRIVVTWQSDDTGDLSLGCVRARIYNADGTAAGDDFLIDRIFDPSATGNQVAPSVAAFADGRFVATWQSQDSGDGSLGCVRARLFNADGTAIGNDFIVDTSTAGVQSAPDITVLTDGRFVVTWTSDDPGDGSGNCLRARIFNSDGTATGNDFIVDSTTDNNVFIPAVTALANGRFTVTWSSSDNGDGSGSCERARLYNANGSAAGNDYLIDSTGFGSQIGGDATETADGRIVYTWWSLDPGDGSSSCIRARIYASDGTAVGNDFILDTSTFGSQQEPGIAALADGRYVIAWPSFDGGDGSGSCIRARMYNLDGTPSGNDFVVNTIGTGNQFNPTIAAQGNDRFVISWNSFDAGDGSGSCVRSQVFDASVFSGTVGDDIYHGASFGDAITGGQGGDTLYGEGGNDRISGDSGNDSLLGGDGNDTLYGGADNDTLLGGNGDDLLIGGTGNDTIDGGAGIDTAVYSTTRAGATITRNANGSTAINAGADGIDTLSNVEWAQFSDARVWLGNPVKHDFNGDGRSDILWRATNGDVYLWSFGAGLVHPGTDLGIVPTNYSIAGTGDLNGDGKVDALWRSDTGDVYLWNSANGGIGTPGGLTGNDIGIVPLSYTVAALADFNGDGKADVLRRVDTGDVYLWNSSGGGIGSVGGFNGIDLGIVPLSYQIAAAADFNGDGKADVLWRSDTGDVYLWNSTGGGIGTTNGLNGIDLGIVPLDYRIAGTGDFNNDVRADILFRSTSSGDAYLWSSASGGIGAPGGFTGVDLGIVPTNYATQIGFA